MFGVYFERIKIVWRQHLSLFLSHYPSRFMNPSVSAISKWKYFLLLKLWCQGYRCKSDIAIFVWKITWNYAHSPFKGCSPTTTVSVEVNISIHCYSADIRIYLLLDNELNRKIDVTVILFLLVQNRHQTHGWTLIGLGANGLGIQEFQFRNQKA